jgi:hypothetical protein
MLKPKGGLLTTLVTNLHCLNLNFITKNILKTLAGFSWCFLPKAEFEDDMVLPIFMKTAKHVIIITGVRPEDERALASKSRCH